MKIPPRNREDCCGNPALALPPILLRICGEILGVTKALSHLVPAHPVRPPVRSARLTSLRENFTSNLNFLARSLAPQKMNQRRVTWETQKNNGSKNKKKTR